MSELRSTSEIPYTVRRSSRARRVRVNVHAHAGVEVRLDIFPEMQHVFQLMAGQIPEADDAVARIGAYLEDRLAR